MQESILTNPKIRRATSIWLIIFIEKTEGITVMSHGISGRTAKCRFTLIATVPRLVAVGRAEFVW